MANHKSAIKRIRQAEKRRLHNKVYRTRARSFVKTARSTMTVKGGKADPKVAAEAVRLAVQDLDRAASRGVIHKRNAARRKSRLMKALASLQAK